MARLNITLPDALYARLERLRDRINLSKVCATALEREATMLEEQPAFTDPRIARLVQRLQSTRERWHQRGYEDGIQWAVELATRDELQSVAIHLAEQNGQQLAAFFQMQGKAHAVMVQHAAPSPAAPPMQRGAWGATISSRPVGQPPMPHMIEKGLHPSIPPMPQMPPGSQVTVHTHGARPFPGFPDSFHPAERIQYWQDQDREMSGEASKGEAARIEIDEAAYLEGWRDAIKGIWQTIAPVLS
jgi:ribosome modulation factor